MSIEIHILEKHINESAELNIKIDNLTSVNGGDICDAYKIESGSQTYFLKTHKASMYNMLRCEAVNLSTIAATNTIKTPQVISHGETKSYSFLLLEYLDLVHSGSHAELGIKLAKLHQHSASYFGWEEYNWIGASSQPNEKYEDWISFWREMRLSHQVDLAKANHAPRSLVKSCNRLLSDYYPIFTDYSPKPSLLHGDLWSGNFAFIADGDPVIYDPASYYGDHEADLAMTELFGGFSQDFYSAYNEHFPIDAGYRVRKDFYNLYHVLNHFNLFGGGYANQAERLCEKVLSEIQ